MGVQAGVIVPHAPLIALGGRPELDIFRRSALDAMETLRGCEVVVLLSSHGERDGVYAEVAGNLDDLGLDGIDVAAPSDPQVIQDLAAAWGHDVLDGGADHGVVGALAMALPGLPVVAATQTEITGPHAKATAEDAVESALLFADALAQVAAERTVGFIASAHTAASLTPKAPLALRPEGKELDDLILDCLATDCGELVRVDPKLWTQAGACGAGPFTAFGVLFEGVRAQVHAYDHPFGVGYLAGSVRHG